LFVQEPRPEGEVARYEADAGLSGSAIGETAPTQGRRPQLAVDAQPFMKGMARLISVRMIPSA